MSENKAGVRLLFLVGVGAAVLFVSTASGQMNVAGAVFTMTNSTDPILGNQVVMYHRLTDGRLVFGGAFPTGGVGSGPAPTSTVFGIPIPATADGLGSQGALLLSDDHRHLFAVNAGSNTVSCFRNEGGTLRLGNVVPSGGVFPSSVAFRQVSPGTGILYVLNSGLDGNVTGFRVANGCVMRRIPHSSRSLAGLIADPPYPSPPPNEVLTTPADIEFSPDGSQLLVALKGLPNGAIVVFHMNPFSGMLSAGPPAVTPFSTAAGNAGPFSFSFDRVGHLIVNHANSFTVASYHLERSGELTLVGGPVPISGLGDQSTNLVFGGFNCWIAINGNIAYVVTFGDIPATNGGLPDGPGIISALEVGDDGSLRRLPVFEFEDEGVVAVLPQDDRTDPNARVFGNHGMDIAVVEGGSSDFLYAVTPRLGSIVMWKINADGTLTGLGAVADGLSVGVDPFPGTNPGIYNFLNRCFLQPVGARSPECGQGSAQGIAGY